MKPPVQLLREGRVKEWNEWRRENPGVVDLIGANLTRADLRGANLDGADMTGANLRGANMIVVDLRGANLTGADLRKADLLRANMTGANLAGSNLTGANMTGATLPKGVPVVEDLDAKILAAIEAGGKLNMGEWHTCETTHCRAGWAIVLADREGKRLEFKYGPATAGALIYAASRPGPLPDFYASNEDALADIERGAASAASDREGG